MARLRWILVLTALASVTCQGFVIPIGEDSGGGASAEADFVDDVRSFSSEDISSLGEPVDDGTSGNGEDGTTLGEQSLSDNEVDRKPLDSLSSVSNELSQKLSSLDGIPSVDDEKELVLYLPYAMVIQQRAKTPGDEELVKNRDEPNAEKGSSPVPDKTDPKCNSSTTSTASESLREPKQPFAYPEEEASSGNAAQEGQGRSETQGGLAAESESPASSDNSEGNLPQETVTQEQEKQEEYPNSGGSLSSAQNQDGSANEASQSSSLPPDHNSGSGDTLEEDDLLSLPRTNSDINAEDSNSEGETATPDEGSDLTNESSTPNEDLEPENETSVQDEDLDPGGDHTASLADIFGNDDEGNSEDSHSSEGTSQDDHHSEGITSELGDNASSASEQDEGTLSTSETSMPTDEGSQTTASGDHEDPSAASGLNEDLNSASETLAQAEGSPGDTPSTDNPNNQEAGSSKSADLEDSDDDAAETDEEQSSSVSETSAADQEDTESESTDEGSSPSATDVTSIDVLRQEEINTNDPSADVKDEDADSDGPTERTADILTDPDPPTIQEDEQFGDKREMPLSRTIPGEYYSSTTDFDVDGTEKAVVEAWLEEDFADLNPDPVIADVEHTTEHEEVGLTELEALDQEVDTMSVAPHSGMTEIEQVIQTEQVVHAVVNENQPSDRTQQFSETENVVPASTGILAGSMAVETAAPVMTTADVDQTKIPAENSPGSTATAPELQENSPQATNKVSSSEPQSNTVPATEPKDEKTSEDNQPKIPAENPPENTATVPESQELSSQTTNGVSSTEQQSNMVPAADPKDETTSEADQTTSSAENSPKSVPLDPDLPKEASQSSATAKEQSNSVPAPAAKDGTTANVGQPNTPIDNSPRNTAVDPKLPKDLPQTSGVSSPPEEQSNSIPAPAAKDQPTTPIVDQPTTPIVDQPTTPIDNSPRNTAVDPELPKDLPQTSGVSSPPEEQSNSVPAPVPQNEKPAEPASPVALAANEEGTQDLLATVNNNPSLENQDNRDPNGDNTRTVDERGANIIMRPMPFIIIANPRNGLDKMFTQPGSNSFVEPTTNENFGHQLSEHTASVISLLNGILHNGENSPEGSDGRSSTLENLAVEAEKAEETGSTEPASGGMNEPVQVRDPDIETQLESPLLGPTSDEVKSALSGDGNAAGHFIVPSGPAEDTIGQEQAMFETDASSQGALEPPTTHTETSGVEKPSEQNSQISSPANGTEPVEVDPRQEKRGEESPFMPTEDQINFQPEVFVLFLDDDAEGAADGLEKERDTRTTLGNFYADPIFYDPKEKNASMISFPASWAHPNHPMTLNEVIALALSDNKVVPDQVQSVTVITLRNVPPAAPYIVRATVGTKNQGVYSFVIPWSHVGKSEEEFIESIIATIKVSGYNPEDVFRVLIKAWKTIPVERRQLQKIKVPCKDPFTTGPCYESVRMLPVVQGPYDEKYPTNPSVQYGQEPYPLKKRPKTDKLNQPIIIPAYKNNQQPPAKKPKYPGRRPRPVYRKPKPAPKKPTYQQPKPTPDYRQPPPARPSYPSQKPYPPGPPEKPRRPPVYPPKQQAYPEPRPEANYGNRQQYPPKVDKYGREMGKDVSEPYEAAEGYLDHNPVTRYGYYKKQTYFDNSYQQAISTYDEYGQPQQPYPPVRKYGQSGYDENEYEIRVEDEYEDEHPHPDHSPVTRYGYYKKRTYFEEPEPSVTYWDEEDGPPADGMQNQYE